MTNSFIPLRKKISDLTDSELDNFLYANWDKLSEMDKKILSTINKSHSSKDEKIKNEMEPV